VDYKKYTVICDYSATGEGRTISIWMGIAENESHAKQLFSEAVYDGHWFSHGVSIIEGFQYDDENVKMFMTPVIKNVLETDCMKHFSSQLHFNFS
jgi:hypothetical protein